MKVIVQRIWKEPAVAIGLIASLILALLQFLGDDVWDVNTIIAVCAPFVSALGIRQTVKPALGAPPLSETPSEPAPPPPIPPGDPEPGDKTEPAPESTGPAPGEIVPE